MTLNKISKKQKLLLKWAFKASTKDKYKAVICDGAVRSGKTTCMTVGFICWAMKNFDKSIFAICGKTIKSVERNILNLLQEQEDITSHFTLEYKRSDNKLIISNAEISNIFYLYGGKDEQSHSLIQGITLSGVMFDEVALMARSFVDQAIARTLSIPNAKFWFNCNPENPNHYFYKEWIEKAEDKRALYIHFLMEDNPILTKQAIEDAKKLYVGVFYDRYILGKWVAAEGLVYPMFSVDKHVVSDEERAYTRFIISCDYGIQNATSMGLWGYHNSKWYRIKEYYHDGRGSGFQKTDEEYYTQLCNLAGGRIIEKVIIDPSAASFIELIRRNGLFRVQAASNRVVDGIREVANHLHREDLLFCASCKDSIREFSMYVWDESSVDDRPIKANDHAMDDIRYFVRDVFKAGLMEF